MGTGINWTDIQNVFYPYEPIPIPPDKLDEWYVERYRSPYRQLLLRLKPDKIPERYILVGHRSSGKTTELVKLTTELRKTHDYFVVYLPLEHNLDISKVNPVEVLFLMGVSIYKIASEELQEKPREELLHRLEQSLTTLVREETDNKNFSIDIRKLVENLVCFGASLLAGPIAGSSLREAFRGFSFVSGTDVKLVRRTEVQPRLKEIADALNDLIEEVKALAGKPPVLVVDGLDRIMDPDLIELNFIENPYLALISCRAIYAGPMLLYYGVRYAMARTRFSIIELPNVMIHDRQRNPSEKGYETMREIVRRRIRSLGYEPEQVIHPDALDLIICNSGGVIRDLMFLMREAALNAEMAQEEIIDKNIARWAVRSHRRLFEVSLTPKYRQVLEEVARTKERLDDPLCDELIMGNFVLSYIDEEGNPWFDVHSILWAED